MACCPATTSTASWPVQVSLKNPLALTGMLPGGGNAVPATLSVAVTVV